MSGALGDREGDARQNMAAEIERLKLVTLEEGAV